MPTGLIHLPKLAVPPAFQATSIAGGSSTSFNSSISRTDSHTATAADGLAGVALMIGQVGNVGYYSTRTCTWAGVSMTELGYFPDGIWFLSIFGLMAPATGTQNVIGTFSGGGNTGREIVLHTGTYTNVGSFGACEAVAGTSQTISANVGETVINIVGGGSAISAYNQTTRSGVAQAPSGGSTRALFGEAPGAASITFSATGIGRSMTCRLLPA
jgi:hypothetical protein